jgi:hypothetical protein
MARGGLEGILWRVGPGSTAEATTETERKMVAPWKPRGEDDDARLVAKRFCYVSSAARANIERESATLRPPHLRLLFPPSSFFAWILTAICFSSFRMQMTWQINTMNDTSSLSLFSEFMMLSAQELYNDHQ